MKVTFPQEGVPKGIPELKSYMWRRTLCPVTTRRHNTVALIRTTLICMNTCTHDSVVTRRRLFMAQFSYGRRRIVDRDDFLSGRNNCEVNRP